MYTPFDNLTDAEFVRYLETRTELSPALVESLRERLNAAADAVAETRSSTCNECGEEVE